MRGRPAWFSLAVTAGVGLTAPALGQTPPSFAPPPVTGPPFAGPTGPGPVPCPPPIIESWDDEAPVPPGYVPRTRRNDGLIISGATVMSSFWLVSGAFGAVMGTVDSGWLPLTVPVVGPFIGLATLEGDVAAALLVADGLAQTAGLGLLLAGVFAEETVLIRTADARTHPERRSEPAISSLSVAPLVSHEHAGWLLRGTF